MPAGDMEKLKFAYAYGADATYVGVPSLFVGEYSPPEQKANPRSIS